MTESWKRELVEALGPDSVLLDPAAVMVYEYDYGLDRSLPQAVVFPTSAREVSAVVRIARQHNVAIVARGAGTGISGGAVPWAGGIVVALTRMNRILSVDVPNRAALVEPGVLNLELSQHLAPCGYFFAPDPSSQRASTIGGNIGENAGGPHCLAYGVTTNHVLGLEVVLPDGEILRTGGLAPDRPGYDLTGVFPGSEGTLGIVTQALVRILPLPEDVRTLLAVFHTIEAAGQAVSDTIAQGIVPTAMEMLDATTIRAVQAMTDCGYPPGAEAVLLVEIEGSTETVVEQIEVVAATCRAAGAYDLKLAEDAAAKAALWLGRKSAASALGRVAPNYYLLDTVVPRSKLPQVLKEVLAAAARHNLPTANVFHAGDGNLHPVVLFDIREPGVLDRVLAATEEMLRASIEVGGTLSGEHGIGLEKRDFMPWIFTESDFAAMWRLKDAFDPDHFFNPGKMLPVPEGEAGHRLPAVKASKANAVKRFGPEVTI